MGKLIANFQMTVDGFVADLAGKNDWQLWDWSEEWNWDNGLKAYFTNMVEDVDCILLSRKMAEEGFIEHWARAAARTDDPRYAFAKKINGTPKLVFSRTIEKAEWSNTKLAKGGLKEIVNRLKRQEGKNMIVFGGANLLSNLIREDLIDEYHLFVNPVVIGEGISVFTKKTSLSLKKSLPFNSGMTVLVYTSC
jgi:dihydrofolate reductase